MYSIYTMDIEWDGFKSAQNEKKHGIDLGGALEIWHGYHLEVDGIARSVDGEERGATVGFVGGEVYTAIWTRRSSCLRLISVRRARKREKEVFVAAIQQQAKNG